MPVTSHLRHLIPSYSSLLSNFFGVSLSRIVIPSAAEGSRSVSHKHRQENDALVLRISAFKHSSFSGLQERFLASLEMTIRKSSSLLVSRHSFFKETLIKSLFDFTLVFSCSARNNPTRIASYLRRVMTKRCMKIHVKSNSAI